MSKLYMTLKKTIQVFFSHVPNTFILLCIIQVLKRDAIVFVNLCVFFDFLSKYFIN